MSDYVIIMTKWAGLSGTVKIAEEKKEELLTKLPEYLIEDAIGFRKYLDTEVETEMLPKACATSVNDSVEGPERKLPSVDDSMPETGRYKLGEGGLYKALYDIAKERNCGITVEAKAIPIRQETIEVCEFYGLNPYMLESFGATLILVGREDVKDLLMKLAKNQIPATRIGNLTEGHDCVVTNGARTTYIKPPKEDELCKLQ